MQCGKCGYLICDCEEFALTPKNKVNEKKPSNSYYSEDFFKLVKNPIARKVLRETYKRNKRNERTKV